MFTLFKYRMNTRVIKLLVRLMLKFIFLTSSVPGYFLLNCSACPGTS